MFIVLLVYSIGWWFGGMVARLCFVFWWVLGGGLTIDVRWVVGLCFRSASLVLVSGFYLAGWVACLIAVDWFALFVGLDALWCCLLL